MLRTAVLTAVAMASSLAIAGASENLDKFATMSGSEISFSLGGSYSDATLTVVGPNNFFARDFSKAGNPSIDLIRAKATVDGLYQYEITAASSDTVPIVNGENNGRDGVDKGIMKQGVAASGTFLVKNGMIVPAAQAAEEAN